MSEDIERLLRLNCPASCDGKGTYAEDDGYDNAEPAQCQWCFEFGMPARTSIDNMILTAVTQDRIKRSERKIVDKGLEQIDELKEKDAWPIP